MKQYQIILCGTFVHFTLTNSVRPYISLLSSAYGAGSLQVGIIAAIYSVVQVALALPVATLINKYGCRKILPYAAVGYIVVCSGLLFVKSLLLIALCVALMGICHTFQMSSFQYMSTRTDLEIDVEKMVGYYAFFNSVGVAAGSYFGGVMQDWLGVNLGFAGGLAASVLNLVFIMMIRSEDGNCPVDTYASAKELLRKDHVLSVLLTGGIIMFSLEVTTTFFPLYGNELGFTAGQTGLVLSVSGFSMMLMRPFLKELIIRYQLFPLMSFCLLASGIGLACYGFTGNLYLLVAIAAVSGLVMGVLNPLCLLAITELVGSAQRAKAQAIRTMVSFTGQALGPICLGALAGLTGYAAVFWITGTGLASGFLLVIRRKQKAADPL